MSLLQGQRFVSVGWCFSAGCRYVSLMHGLSSRFISSLKARSLVARVNPSFPERLEFSTPSTYWPAIWRALCPDR